MLSTTIKVAESARDLGVILDAELTMSAHVTALCQSGFFQLSYVHSSGHSLRKLPRHWFRHSYRVVWTTAIRFCME